MTAHDPPRTPRGGFDGLSPAERAHLDQELAFFREWLPRFERMVEVIVSWVVWARSLGRPMTPAEAAAHPSTVDMHARLILTRDELRRLGGDPGLLRSIEAMIQGLNQLDRALDAWAAKGESHG